MESNRYNIFFYIGPLQSTRCIGNYISKMGYKDCSHLSGAISEPVLSQPEIVGAIPLDDSCRFILLMSDGLCKALHDVYSSEGNLANKKIVEMVVEQVPYFWHSIRYGK